MPICDLFKDLRSYEGKIVSVRGMLYQGKEVLALGGRCEAKFITPFGPPTPDVPGVLQSDKMYVWPCALNLAEAPGDITQRQPAPFQTNAEDVGRVLQRIALARSRLSSQEAEVWVTVVGQLRLRSNYTVGKLGGGNLYGGGYGNGGVYPGELAIKTLLEPVVGPASGPLPEVPAPVPR